MVKVLVYANIKNMNFICNSIKNEIFLRTKDNVTPSGFVIIFNISFLNNSITVNCKLIIDLVIPSGFEQTSIVNLNVQFLFFYSCMQRQTRMSVLPTFGISIYVLRFTSYV
jgi:hypothetical protein